MPRDARLDAFAGADSGEAATGDAEETEAVEAEAVEAEVDATVDPVTSTYAWSPTGRCDRCGDAGERRWRDGADLVCADCKSWDQP